MGVGGALLHPNCALSGGQHDPEHRCGIEFEPMRHGDAPRRPRYQSWHRSAGGERKGRTDALCMRDLREERAAVYEECEGTALVEELGPVHVLVLDQQVEEHDCICRIFSEWSAGRSWFEEWTGAGRIWLGAATETDGQGVWGVWWEA